MYKLRGTLQNAIAHQYSRLPKKGFFFFFLVLFSCLVCIVFFLEKPSTIQANINIVLRIGRLWILLAIARKKLSEYIHKSSLFEIHSTFNFLTAWKKSALNCLLWFTFWPILFWSEFGRLFRIVVSYTENVSAQEPIKCQNGIITYYIAIAIILLV